MKLLITSLIALATITTATAKNAPIQLKKRAALKLFNNLQVQTSEVTRGRNTIVLKQMDGLKCKKLKTAKMKKRKHSASCKIEKNLSQAQIKAIFQTIKKKAVAKKPHNQAVLKKMLKKVGPLKVIKLVKAEGVTFKIKKAKRGHRGGRVMIKGAKAKQLFQSMTVAPKVKTLVKRKLIIKKTKKLKCMKIVALQGQFEGAKFKCVKKK